MEYHSPLHYKHNIAAQRSTLEAAQALNRQQFETSGLMGRLLLREESVILNDKTCQVIPCRLRVRDPDGFVDGAGICLRIPDTRFRDSFHAVRTILVGVVGFDGTETYEPFDDEDSIMVDSMLTGLEQARDAYNVLPDLSPDCTTIYG